jgi:hypothetical protein
MYFIVGVTSQYAVENLMEQNSSLEADSYSANQEISHLYGT